jgi:transglutaminase-like putative cysteine protease
LAGITARYVTGFIIGEGVSHAWVEFLDHDQWYGIDPTNNKLVNDEYIKIGHGRDAKDCMINRGIMHGGGPHTQSVRVNVQEV